MQAQPFVKLQVLMCIFNTEVERVCVFICKGSFCSYLCLFISFDFLQICDKPLLQPGYKLLCANTSILIISLTNILLTLHMLCVPFMGRTLVLGGLEVEVRAMICSEAMGSKPGPVELRVCSGYIRREQKYISK